VKTQEKCIPGSQDYSLYFTVLLQKLPKNPSNSSEIARNKYGNKRKTLFAENLSNTGYINRIGSP
jgi:hypothetical protein